MSDEFSPDIEQQPESSEGAKLVPVAESIKYRRRAQQAESKVQEYEQKLDELRQQVQTQEEQLSQTQGQRDEVLSQLVETDNRRQAEKMLAQVGAVDLETATMLLEKRVDLGGEISQEQLNQQVQQLLEEKPFLRPATKVTAAPMPAMTSSPRQNQPTIAAQLSGLAQKATQSGNRRDIGEYLRLRRQLANRL